MAYRVQNIIVGAAALWIGVGDSTQVGYTAPAIPATSGAGVTYAQTLEASPVWRGVGYTTNGLSLSYQPSWGDVEVDQLLDSARIFKQSMRVMITTTLVEAALENLIVAWGQQNGTLASTTSDATVGIAAGALGDDPVERSLAAVGPAPRQVGTNAKRERLYQARRVLSVENTEISLQRAAATEFPISFRLLPDSNFPGSEYGVIRDRVLA